MTAANVFSIQTEIAKAIASALRATLSSDEERRIDYAPTQSLAAMDSYFLGKQLLEERNRDSLLAALAYFQKVIELDPEYALAHSGLADAYMLLPEYPPTIDIREAIERSEEAAERALEVDPNSTLMAMNLSYIRTDAGLFDESIAGTVAAGKKDPNYPELPGNLWLTYMRAGRPLDAVNSIVTWARATGRSAEDAREISGAFVQYATTGQRQDLDSATLSRMEFGLEDLAQVYAFVGDRERTLAALEDGYEQRAGSRSVLSMKINPGYDFIRSDPRFIELEMLSGLRDRF